MNFDIYTNKIKNPNNVTGQNTNKQPYMNAVEKALQNGESVFKVAKVSRNSCGQSSSVVDAKSGAALAKEGAQYLTEAAKESKGEAKKVLEILGASKLLSKVLTGKIKSKEQGITASYQKIQGNDREIQSLAAQRDALVSDSSSKATNPFDGTGSGKNSAFSLDIAAAPPASPKTAKGGLITGPDKAQNNKTTEDVKNPETQQKIDEYNSQISAKTNENKNKQKETKEKEKLAKEEFKAGNEKLNGELEKVNDYEQKSKDKAAEAQRRQQEATGITQIGTNAVSAAGTMKAAAIAGGPATTWMIPPAEVLNGLGIAAVVGGQAENLKAIGLNAAAQDEMKKAGAAKKDIAARRKDVSQKYVDFLTKTQKHKHIS